MQNIYELFPKESIEGLKHEFESLSNDLIKCQKYNQFLEKYRKYLINITNNCKCNESINQKIIINLLEKEYKTYSDNYNNNEINIKTKDQVFGQNITIIEYEDNCVENIDEITDNSSVNETISSISNENIENTIEIKDKAFDENITIIENESIDEQNNNDIDYNNSVESPAIEEISQNVKNNNDIKSLQNSTNEKLNENPNYKVKWDIRSGKPGIITCSICNSTKYYSHVQKRHGVFSCEPCRKFFYHFIKSPKQYLCLNNGHCPIDESNSKSNESRRNITRLRCKACWLKTCLQKYSIDSHIRQTIEQNFYPKLMSVDKQKRHQSENPDISQNPTHTTISLDQNKSTNEIPVNSSDSVSHFNESLINAETGTVQTFEGSSGTRAGPRVKRVCRSADAAKLYSRAVFGPDSDETDSDELPIGEYLCRAYKQKEKKRLRCRQCAGCLASDCGQCNHCLDKKKFGGNYTMRQACKLRKCWKLNKI